MKKNYKMKKTISVKMFVSELGGNFSEHMKERLLDLEVRCVLTRKEDSNILDLKHVEHNKYDCNCDGIQGTCQKEYAYGQFIVIDGILYFSEKCAENDKVMQSPIINEIYNSLSSESIICDAKNENENECIICDAENKEETDMPISTIFNAKKVDDTNIDYVIDKILSVCPHVSESYLKIVREMISHSESKAKTVTYGKSYR